MLEKSGILRERLAGKFEKEVYEASAPYPGSNRNTRRGRNRAVPIAARNEGDRAWLEQVHAWSSRKGLAEVGRKIFWPDSARFLERRIKEIERRFHRGVGNLPALLPGQLNDE